MTVFPILIDGVSVYVLFKYIKFTIFLKIIQLHAKECVILGVVKLRVFCPYRCSTIVLYKLRIGNFCSQYIFFKPSFISTFKYYYRINFLINLLSNLLFSLKQIRFHRYVLAAIPQLSFTNKIVVNHKPSNLIFYHMNIPPELDCTSEIPKS